MTTHWIISIGRPKLPVISGKAIFTALSRGTTDVPRPISTSRSHCLAVIPGHAVERVSAREPVSVFTTQLWQRNDARSALLGKKFSPATRHGTKYHFYHPLTIRFGRFSDPFSGEL